MSNPDSPLLDKSLHVIDSSQDSSVHLPSQNPSHDTFPHHSNSNCNKNDTQHHKQDACNDTGTKFKPKFIDCFLPISFYLVYILLTSMQELPMTSIAWILTNTTEFTPEELTIYYNLSFIPWTIKPLWGFIADNIPICGYRRKPYMVFFSVLASAVFVAIPLFKHEKGMMRILGVLQSLCVVFSEVQIDGLVVALSNRLVTHQTALYKHFPEFKRYVDRHDKKETKSEGNKLVGSDVKKPTSTNSINNTNTCAGKVDDDGINQPLLNHSSDSSSSHSNIHIKQEIDDDNTTFQRKSQSSSQGTIINNNIVTTVDNNKYTGKGDKTIDEKDEILTPSQIFLQNPHYYDLLTPQEYQLLLTKQPKASIQSEAMTFRTIASLISALISLVLHLFLSPGRVVWVCAALPIMLIVVIIIMVPEKDEVILSQFADRIQMLTAALSIHSKDCSKQPQKVLDNGDGDDGNDDKSNAEYKSERFIDQFQCKEHKTLEDSSQCSHSHHSSSTTSLLSQSPSCSGSATSSSSSLSSTTSKLTKDHQSNSEQHPMCFSCVCSRIVATFNAVKLIWKPLLFMLILRSMPTPTDPMMSYIFVHLTLPPWLLSGYSFICIAGGLLSSLVYWKLFVNIRLLPSLILFTIIAAIGSTVTNLMLTTEWIDINIIRHHIPNWTKVFVAAFVGAAFSRLSLMPTIILAAETAPQHFGLEATMFSIYTGVNNIGNVVAIVGNLWLINHLHITNDDFSGLPMMILICGGASILPLFFSPLIYCTQQDLKKLKQEDEEKKAKEEAEKEEKEESVLVLNLDNDTCVNNSTI